MIKFSDILLESSEKIKCNHCGWSWKKSEGGKDLHVCHKCGHDSNPNSLDTFAQTRLIGATKISDNAKKKGGPSMLTYHHFVVKLPYYKKAAKGWSKEDRESAVKEYGDLLEELYSTKDSVKIDQTAFQKLVGKIEVLGELVIKYDEIY